MFQHVIQLYIPCIYKDNILTLLTSICSAVVEREIDLGPPKKVPTPYGGQLVWKMPGGNVLVVHLKAKHLIRHSKRWSQVHI